MARRKIVYMPLAELESAPINPKGHALELIARSIDRFGLVEVPTAPARAVHIEGCRDSECDGCWTGV